MFDNVKKEYIQENGVSNGDTTKRSDIFKDYQLVHLSCGQKNNTAMFLQHGDVVFDLSIIQLLYQSA